MVFRHLSIAIVLSMGIIGYPVLASVLSLLGATDSNFPSIVFRSSVAAMAIVALVLNRDRIRLYHSTFFLAISVFWVAYITRLIHDSYITRNLGDLYDPVTVIVTGLTFVFIPMLASLIGLNEKNRKAAYSIIVAGTILAAILMLADARELIFDLVERNQIRFQLDKLDPISVGYVGGILFILSALNLLKNIQKFRLTPLAFCVLGGVTGLFIMMVSGSRGPVVAAVVALVFYWLVPPRAPKLILGCLLVAGAAIVLSNIQQYVSKQFDLDVSTRFVEAAEGEATSFDAREVAFDSAWQQFKDNPLLGDSFFVEGTGGYPHNLVLEALMSTGIIGGVAYIVAAAIMLLSAVRLLARENGYEWLALLGIFFLVAAQFSGTHWSFGAHWQTFILVVTAEVASRSDASVAKRHRKRRRRSVQASPRRRHAEPSY